MTEHRVVYLPGAEPPSEVIRKAGDNEFQDVLVIGWNPDDTLYYDTSLTDRAHVIYLIEALRSHLMSPDDD